MNEMPRALIPMDSQERKAEALAEITRTHDELTDAKAVILQLRADLHREQDRVVMMVEERDRYRHESIRFRKLMMTLAVKMADAGLVLEAAKDVLQEIEEIDGGETPTSTALDALERTKI